MIASFKRIEFRRQLFDPTGLLPEQVRVLYVLIISVMGGVVWANATTGIAMTAYMKDLGASDSLYGLVMVLPALCNAFQFLVSYWLEKTGKRMNLFLVAGLVQRLVWLPIALVPVFIPISQSSLRLWAVLVLAIISAASNPMQGASFNSLFNDSVPIRIRGRYMATRSKLSTIVSLFMGLIIGMLLDRLPPLTNYVVVFLIAAMFGTLDILCFFFAKFPDMQRVNMPPKLGGMLKNVLSDRKYMRIVLALTCWFFTLNICSPYFNVFARMETGVGLSNFEIMLSGLVIYNVLLILVISRWGRAMDEFGNKPVLVVAAILTSFVPAFWIRIGPGMFWIVLLSNALSGLSYCAVDICSTNLFMMQAPAKNRSMYFAVYIVFTQLFGLTLGTLTGGLLLDNVFSHVDSLNLVIAGVAYTRYNALYTLGFILRLSAALFLLTSIKEQNAPHHTIDLVRAMLSVPQNLWHTFLYGMRRKQLRKQYDSQIRAEASAQENDETGE